MLVREVEAEGNTEALNSLRGRRRRRAKLGGGLDVGEEDAKNNLT